MVIRILADKLSEFVDSIQSTTQKTRSEVPRSEKPNHLIFFILFADHMKTPMEQFGLGIFETIDRKGMMRVSQFSQREKQDDIRPPRDETVNFTFRGKIENLARLKVKSIWLLSVIDEYYPKSTPEGISNPTEDLSVRGLDSNRKQLFCFNAENAPNMPRAQAARVLTSPTTILKSPGLNVSRFSGNYDDRASARGSVSDSTMLFADTKNQVAEVQDQMRKQFQLQSRLTCF